MFQKKEKEVHLEIFSRLNFSKVPAKRGGTARHKSTCLQAECSVICSYTKVDKAPRSQAALMGQKLARKLYEQGGQVTGLVPTHTAERNLGPFDCKQNHGQVNERLCCFHWRFGGRRHWLLLFRRLQNQSQGYCCSLLCPYRECSMSFFRNNV